jgi:hypothetical protein
MAEELNLFIQSVPLNPVFDRGADTVYALQLRDMSQKAIDLTGYRAKLTIYASPTVARFGGDPIDTLTTEDGRLGGRDDAGNAAALGADGVLWVNFPKETTVGYTWRSAWYKLEIISAGGQVYRIADGQIQVRD